MSTQPGFNDIFAARDQVRAENSNVHVNVDEHVDVVRPRQRKPRFDETHARHTVWLSDENGKRLARMCSGYGDKTFHMNAALDMYFQHLLSKKP